MSVGLAYVDVVGIGLTILSRKNFHKAVTHKEGPAVALELRLSRTEYRSEHSRQRTPHTKTHQQSS